MNSFADNPDCVTYKWLLTELDRLIADGKGDDEEAEAVRNKTDGSWYRLSSEEIDHILGQSTDSNARG